MTRKIVISGMVGTGTLSAADQKARYGNPLLSLNCPNQVMVDNCVFGQNGYNGIEIGLNPAIRPPHEITIEDVQFTGTLTNNAISVFATRDNAVINILRCKFNKISNLLRLSNRTNATGVVVNIFDCEVTEWESDPAWAGIIICQDYTSKDAAEVQSNNLFAPAKLTINIKNLKHNGVVVANPQDVSTVINSRNAANQLLYTYFDKGNPKAPAFEADRVPTLVFM